MTYLSAVDILFQIVPTQGNIDWAICGGLALDLHGVRKNDGHDWDILVTPKLFEKMASGLWRPSGTSNVSDLLTYPILHTGLYVEALLTNPPDKANLVDRSKWWDYLASATCIPTSGLARVVTLEDLLCWKAGIRNSINQAKHDADAQRIREHMESRKTQREVEKY